MKKLGLLIVFLFASAASAQTVCTPGPNDPCVSVNQSFLDRVSQGLKESELKDKLIAAYKNVGILTDVERTAFQAALKATTDAFDARGKVITDMERINAIKDKLIDVLMALADKLQTKLNAPKSAWAKFVEVLKEIAYITTGIAIGRHF